MIGGFKHIGELLEVKLSHRTHSISRDHLIADTGVEMLKCMIVSSVFLEDCGIRIYIKISGGFPCCSVKKRSRNSWNIELIFFTKNVMKKQVR